MADEKISEGLTEEEAEAIEKEEEKNEAIINRKNLESNLTNLWGYSSTGIEAKKAAMSMLATKTGMYSRVPIICKAENCPYAEKCTLLSYNLSPYGEPCPMETSQIELRYEGYNKDFDLNENASFTDKTLVSELINCDILLERCKALLSKEGILVEQVFAGVSEEGEEFTRPEITKNWEAYERVSNRREKIYKLLQATREDKKGGNSGVVNDVAQFVKDLTSNNNDFIIEETPKEFIDINPEDNL